MTGRLTSGFRHKVQRERQGLAGGSRVLRRLERPHGSGLPSPSLLNSLEASAAFRLLMVLQSRTPAPYRPLAFGFDLFQSFLKSLLHSFSGARNTLITSLRQLGPPHLLPLQTHAAHPPRAGHAGDELRTTNNQLGPDVLNTPLHTGPPLSLLGGRRLWVSRALRAPAGRLGQEPSAKEGAFLPGCPESSGD